MGKLLETLRELEPVAIVVVERINGQVSTCIHTAITENLVQLVNKGIVSGLRFLLLFCIPILGSYNLCIWQFKKITITMRTWSNSLPTVASYYMLYDSAMNLIH